MNLLSIHSLVAQVVKPYDPDSMPDITTSTQSTDSITPIIIVAGLATMVLIIVVVLLVKKRH